MAFTTRPELRGTFGMVASTHWLASAVGMSVLERGGQRVRRRVRDRVHAPGRRAAPERPRRAGPGGLLVGEPRAAARALRPGSRARRGDDRALRRARARPDPGHGASRRVRPGRLRRLAAAAARVRYLAPRGRPRAGDRIRGARLPAPRADPRDDRAHRRAPRDVARVARPLPARASRRRAVPEPGARGDVSPDRRGIARRLARGGDRARADGMVRRLRRRGDRPLLRRRGRAADRCRSGRLGGDARAGRHLRLPRAHRVQDLRVGRGAGSACSSSRCSRASTSPSSPRPSSCTS